MPPSTRTHSIELRGVRVHNLKNVDLDIPHGQLLAMCGVSGSGKTSLALDTLYAEGQRRYIESFSPYTRQFLQQLDKPDADSIQGIPPAIAIRAASSTTHRTATVGSATETYEHLRLLYSRIASATCPTCQTPIERDDAESAAGKLQGLPPDSRFQIVFPLPHDESNEHVLDLMRRHGFVRAILGGQTCELNVGHEIAGPLDDCRIVVDRLTSGSPVDRIRDSLETAFEFGQGVCEALIVVDESESQLRIDGRHWKTIAFTDRLSCPQCGLQLPDPEPNLFSYRSPMGACAECHGMGTQLTLDRQKVIPNPRLSLAEGAIAVWNAPKYHKQRDHLLYAAEPLGLDVNTPFRELPTDQQALIWDGCPDGQFEGLLPFLRELTRGKESSTTKDSSTKWLSSTTCQQCNGARLNPLALSFQVGQTHIAKLCSMEVADAIEFIRQLQLEPWQTGIANRILYQVQRRLGYLEQVGLGYLTLDRRLNTLSSGETQRVMMTTALGSTLINMLYVLDEPTTGLHADDVARLIPTIKKLHARGNTVVFVDHNVSMLRHADRIVEMGPGAGEEGGEVEFDGDYSTLVNESSGVTSQFLNGKRGFWLPESRRSGRGKMKLVGASGHNLKKINALFPLGCLCAVSGVSGSGKSSLVEGTLYPALAQKQEGRPIPSLPYEEIIGDNQINEVVLIDQSPIGRSPRSNPVTYVKAFDDIRKLFAEQATAKARNFTAGHFSFNVAKGRCPKCEGEGHLKIDMQFLSDLYVRCDSCRGTRFRSEILEVKHRGKNIAQVLEMPIGSAFAFFRGQPKVQAKLKTLMDVGLGYLSLGQPATTLSTGEAQRLKLALYLNAKNSKRCLFIMDEPTAGLHMADIANLLETFEALIAVGHSLIVVEHNLQFLRQADWIIDMGPGAGADGGTIVAEGTPEELAEHPQSRTGHYLKEALSIHE